MVYFSSAEVYGQPSEDCIPTSESVLGQVPIDDRRSIYAESKRMAEVLGQVLSEQHGIKFTVVRPWNLFGQDKGIMTGGYRLSSLGKQSPMDESLIKAMGRQVDRYVTFGTE